MRLNAAQKDKGLGTVYTYTTNWDADMVYGCVCREGYTGGDCSKRMHSLSLILLINTKRFLDLQYSLGQCVSGDDPLTGAITDTLFGYQQNDKQTVFCSATVRPSLLSEGQQTYSHCFAQGGTFTLSFRGKTTVLINAIDKSDVVSTKLNVRLAPRMFRLSLSLIS